MSSENARDNYIQDYITSDQSEEFEDSWMQAVRLDGDVPICDSRKIEEITEFTKAVVNVLMKMGCHSSNNRSNESGSKGMMYRFQVHWSFARMIRCHSYSFTLTLRVQLNFESQSIVQWHSYLSKVAGLQAERVCVYSQHEK